MSVAAEVKLRWRECRTRDGSHVWPDDDQEDQADVKLCPVHKLVREAVDTMNVITEAEEKHDDK